MVVGFNEREAVGYLCDGHANQDDSHRAAAVDIYKRFSGLPLAMQMVRRYCQFQQLSYDKYISKVEKRSANVMSHENEAVTNEYKSDGSHLFDRITRPLFRIHGKENEEAPLHWNFLACLSHLHCEYIPPFILEHFYKILHQDLYSRRSKKSSRDVEFDSEVNRLVNHLVDESSCVRKEDGGICFETVVANAFVITRQERDSDFNSLKKSITMMISLTKTKEAKEKQTLTKLRIHLERLHQLAKNDTSISKSEKEGISKVLKNANKL